MSSSNYRVSKSNSRHVFEKLPERIEFQPRHFGFPDIEGEGYGVKICIIDTGFPFHPEIAVPHTNVIDFTQGDSAQDKHGHGSGIAGIIKSKGPNLVGLAPSADVFYAKALGSDGSGEHGSVQAAVLYAIIKKVNIIVMAFGSEMSHPVLHDAIKKAHKAGCCIFSASGHAAGSTKDAEYPARFPEVMSVGFGAVSSPTITSSEVLNIDFPTRTADTLYLDGQFARMSGTSILAPVAAGVAARLVGRRKAAGTSVFPNEVYAELMGLCNRGT